MQRTKYPRFSFEGRVLQYKAGECDLYDPDTLTAAFPVEGVMYDHSFRVEGYDSIENRIKKTELQALSIEQRAALLNRRDEALQFTNNLFDSYPCTVYTGKSDKYGRILCRVVFSVDSPSGVKQVDLATALIERNLVFVYHGDTKLTLDQQADFCIKNKSVIKPLTD